MDMNMMDEQKQIDKLKEVLAACDTVVIGAGAGLSTSAGFTYSGDRFMKYFRDFAEQRGIRDMYSGGFYPYSSPEEMWAWWSRQIWINRYVRTPGSVYDDLLELVKDKDYFVITTNVDHQFQKAVFDKDRLYYTQGDYGLWQCSVPCHKRTYDNKSKVMKMLYAQGFSIGADGELAVPTDENGNEDFTQISMEIPSGLVPHCPVCGELMTLNLRSDDRFVEDEGWHAAADRYTEYLKSHMKKKVLFLELGVGGNTPGIIKYNFWRMTYDWPDATYACVNFGEAFAPEEISEKSICINDDIGDVLKKL